MSKVLDFSDVNKFFPSRFSAKRKDSALFSTLGSHVDVYFPPRKRSRISAPFIVSEEPKEKQPSIEVLPDECLFEILRRLPGGQERCNSASVSKRWLMLLSTISRDEICTSENAQTEEPESMPQKANDSPKLKEKHELEHSNEAKSEDVEETDSLGYLSRSLEGKKATDVRLAAIAVGTASRGGLGKLFIRGSNSSVGPTNLGLKAISKCCPSLRVLSLWNLSSINDEGLYEIASGIPSLEKLDLSHCPAITDKGLIAIAKNSPNLTSVTLESCANVGNEGLEALGRYCLNLKFVTVKNCPLVADRGISGLFSSAGHVLTKVKLQGVDISDVSLAVIGHYGSEITDLSLVSLQNVNERGFWAMGKGRGLKKMRSLSVTACNGVSDLVLETVGQGCPDLKILALKKCMNVSDNGVAQFAKTAVLLERLHLEECHRITQLGLFGILANCGEKLKVLALENCLSIRDVDHGFPLTFSCPSLRSLTVRNCPGFGDVGLGSLGRVCPNLTQVDLGNLQSVTDVGVLPLVENSEAGLVKVNLDGCANLTDNTVAAIAKLHGETLEILNLDGCKRITNASLVEIARNCCVLIELDISQCGVTDSGVAALARAQQISLHVFSLSGCSLVSDKILPFLVVLGKNLVGLNIQRCRGLSSSTGDQLLNQLWSILFLKNAVYPSVS